MDRIYQKIRLLPDIEKSRKVTFDMRAVSLRSNPPSFLTLRRNLTLARDFTLRHPLYPFHLTQIEMTGIFPIDSSTCESTILFLHGRRGAQHFCR
jgi:hypothetical protein